jgi:hypothetical protein
MLDPRGIAGEALVACPFGMTGDLAEARELAVVADGEDHVAVGGGKSW